MLSALKCHIEWTQDGDVKNQYLWIENHQRIAAHDVSAVEWDPCKDSWAQGIYVQMQVGKDLKFPNTGSTAGDVDELFRESYGSGFQRRNTLGSWMFPLTAEGNWDYKWRDDLAGTISNCFAPGIGSIPKDKHSSETLPNPFTGFSDVFAHYNANHSANVLTSPFWTGLCEIDASSNIICDGSYRGDSEDAFRCYPDPCPKKILSLSTNPAPVPVYTYKSNQADPNYEFQFPSWENRTIWLNGLSIELLEENVNPILYGPGAVKVKIRFDDYDVENDVRWCASENFNTGNGGIKLSPNDFNIAQPSLNLKTGKTILIDRGKSGTQHKGYEQDASGGWIFTQPTLFSCLPNSYFHMEPNSTVIVDNKSKLVLNNNSKLEIENGAQLIVRNGSTLVLEAGSNLIVHNGGRVVIEGTGTLEYGDNTAANGATNIELNGATAVLEIQGRLDIKQDADFTFSPNTWPHGYVLFSSTAFPSTNITAGTNTKMTFTGNDKLKKFLEITQESVYTPDDLVAFTCSSGTVAMGAGSRLQMSGALTNGITFYNTRVTSTIKANDPGNPSPYNAHRGLTLFGQQNVTINMSLFEYGRYGIYGFLTYGGAPLSITNSTFRYCNFGLWTEDKGASLTSCNFYGNANAGWWAQFMSFPSITRYGQFGLTTSSNPVGVSFDGGGTSNLFMFDPSVLNNQIGVSAYGVPLYVQCGTISSNSQYGINLENGASLDMSYNVNSTGQLAQVTAINNGITIRPWFASGLNLNGGYNNLTPAVSGTQSAVNGKLIWDCLETTFLDANNNMWNAGANPISSSDYSLQSHHLVSPCTITLIDNNSVVPAPCGQANPPPCTDCRDSDPLFSCADCEEISTENFDETKVNEATQITIELTKETTTPNNYRNAVSLFHQILTAEIPNPTDQERYVLSLGYKKMLEALGDAFNAGQIIRAENASTLAPEVQMTIDVLDDIIEKSSTAATYDYHKLFMASMEKAQVYRLADRRELALPIYDNILTWAGTDDIDYVQKWRCATNIEHLALTNEIAKEDVAEIMEDPCAYVPSSNRMASDAMVYDESMLTVVPNPVTTVFTVTTYVPETSLDAQIVVYDLVGGKVSATNVPPGLNKIELNSAGLKNGIYFFTLQSNGATVSKVKVAVVK